MKMIRHFMGCIREYKKPTVLTLLCMVGEVAIEVLIPFFTANLVNVIKNGAALGGVVRVGLVLILMSLVSLGCGALGGLFGSRASAGFAKNVRHDVFTRVQSFAFENIDKFSSASLVTRMTTDINNVQMSFMMCIRIAVRAPLMFLFAVIMAYIMGGALATTFLIIIPVLVIGLLLIARKAMPAFRAVSTAVFAQLLGASAAAAAVTSIAADKIAAIVRFIENPPFNSAVSDFFFVLDIARAVF